MTTLWADLTAAQQQSLQRLAVAKGVPARVAWRARIVAERARSGSDSAVAARFETTRATVALWRRRYQEHGLSGLYDRPRRGRPPGNGDARHRAVPATSDSAGNGSQFRRSGSMLTDLTLERLLSAASRTISRRGFTATRMADIASEAGVSTATLHYYFNTRREILVRSLLWSNEQLVAQLARVTRDQDPPLVRLAKFVERTIPYPGAQRDEYLLELDLWSQARLHRDLLPAWEDFAERWIGHLRQIVTDGIADGSFTTRAPAAEITERIVAMTDGLSGQVGTGSTRMPPDRARELLLRFVAEQVGVSVSRLKRHAHLPGAPQPHDGTELVRPSVKNGC